MSDLVEIERKFLLRDGADELSQFKGMPYTLLTQGYLSFDGTEVRIRFAPGKAPKIGFKRGDGLVRTEFEFDVSEEAGAQLLALAEPYVIRKRRYVIRSWEVDFFTDGISDPIAEIELPSAEWEFYAPGWVDTDREVTGNPAYLNRNIALRAGAAVQGAAGYHLRHIPKGILGEVSKIREELEELEDAAIQRNHLLQLVEASDLYGALRRFAASKNVTMHDLEAMADATQRAFAVGART